LNEQIFMKKIFNEIKIGNNKVLDKSIYSEDDLSVIGCLINEEIDQINIIQNLITQIPMYGKNYDWNVGSILQHVNVKHIIELLKSINDPHLYNSIGLAWVFGEYKNTNRCITDFLFNVIEKSTNSDAWWRSAFSLEKLGIEEAVNLLKMSLKTKSFRSLDYYLKNIFDKKSVISILILSNVENIENIIYPKVKKIFLSTNDYASIIV